MIAQVSPVPLSRDHLAVARRWALLAVLAVAAMVPWYTLRLFPLVAFGTAKVNLLDGLVGAAVVLALPAIVPLVRGRSGPVLWVLAFMAYLLIPLAIGLRDPAAAPRAIREFRALAFYALALAFAAEGTRTADFRAFRAVFVAGACVAVAAVFAHLRWLLVLPGYVPDRVIAPPGFHVLSLSWNEHLSTAPTIPVATSIGYRVEYLEWTVPLVAFVLSLGGALTAPSRRASVLWGISAGATVWYLLASGARSPQIAALSAAAALGAALWRGGRARLALLAGAAAVLIVVAAAALGARSSDARSVEGPASTTLLRWSQVFTDSSLRIRAKEVLVSLPLFARHPITGEGLGGVIPLREFETDGRFPRVIASGYGYLLVKTGLLGLLLYAGMTGSILGLGWRTLRRSPNAASRPAVLIGEVGIAILLLLNLVHPVVDIPEGVIAFSLFFGMIFAGSHREGVHPAGAKPVRRTVDLT